MPTGGLIREALPQGYDKHTSGSGRKIRKKVERHIKQVMLFNKGGYGAFCLLPQISRNLTFNRYLFWPVSGSLKPVLHQNLEELTEGIMLINKAWR